MGELAGVNKCEGTAVFVREGMVIFVFGSDLDTPNMMNVCLLSFWRSAVLLVSSAVLLVSSAGVKINGARRCSQITVHCGTVTRALSRDPVLPSRSTIAQEGTRQGISCFCQNTSQRLCRPTAVMASHTVALFENF